MMTEDTQVGGELEPAGPNDGTRLVLSPLGAVLAVASLGWIYKRVARSPDIRPVRDVALGVMTGTVALATIAMVRRTVAG